MSFQPQQPHDDDAALKPVDPEIPTSRPAQGRSLLVNYISLLSGTVTAKALSLLTVLMLTRYLSLEDFGRYSLVFSFWALLNTLSDLGGGALLGREISKNPNNPRPSVETVIYLRLLGCAVFMPLGFALAKFLGLQNNLIILAFLGLLVGFEAFYESYFSATMRLDQNAKARFFSSLLSVALMGLAIVLGMPLPVVVLIGLLGPLFKFLFDYRYAPFAWRIHRPDWGHIARMARDGWPLWLAGLQFILLARVDTFMLQVLAENGEQEIGIYAAAFRFSEIMALLINALCPALLPLLVKHMHEPDKIRFLTQTGTRLILTVLMAMSLAIFWYAPWITRIYGPGYEAAAEPMQILIWSQALVAVNTLCYQLLMVYNAQGKRPVLLASLLMTGVNIGLNFWLIPPLGAAGASWATVVTEFMIVLLMLGFLRWYTPLRLGRDVLVMEALAGLACLSVIPLGSVYGWVSMIVLLGLVFGLRLLTPASLRTLARERLHEDPPTPR